ncbi:hypothetical protein [uncultured Thiocystis sp.]|jgi:hypothetical protein|uniref:hypothetical protein n=1 Tax=uncultured Thiocystis sp. TaxID=1202134 RepID=UPI0025EBC524|nr:hypothetical protein [uncultured Thiocystis sp.]
MTTTARPSDCLTRGELSVILALTLLVTGHRPEALARVGRQITQTWMEGTAAL